MNRLDLDYQGRARLFTWSGAVLLALALAAVAATGAQYLQLARSAVKAEADLARLEQSVHAPTTESRSGGHESREVALEVKSANEVLRQLSLPWEDLFKGVESSSGKDVSLLGLEPNVEKHQVKISAEAKNIAAMLDYAHRLEAGDVFGTVYLLNHQIQQQDPERPVRFAVVAAWKEKP